MNNGKYGPAIVKEICGHISEGLNKRDACVLSGIVEDTFYRWLKEKPEFSEAIKNAEVGYKKSHIKTINVAREKNWTASAWMLERKWPEEFGARQELKHSGEVSAITFLPSNKPRTENAKRKAD